MFNFNDVQDFAKGLEYWANNSRASMEGHTRKLDKEYYRGQMNAYLQIADWIKDGTIRIGEANVTKSDS